MNLGQIQDAPVSLWALRLHTIKAIFLILRAQWLIRRSPISRWRGSLGDIVEPSAAKDVRSIGVADLRFAAAQARRVARAATRFPFEPKCLPQAMALQWMLAPAGLPSRLVIAMQKGVEEAGQASEHAFHAWVELADQMLIGSCDRSQYRIVLAFEHKPAGPQ